MKVKAIIFDIDGVLLDSFEANFKFYVDLMERNGYPAPTKEDYKNMTHLPLVDVVRIFTKSTDEAEITRIWEMGRSREVPYPFHLLDSPKDADNVVAKLSEKYLLAIVTNRVREGVFESPQLNKLKKYFKAVISFQDTKKP